MLVQDDETNINIYRGVSWQEDFNLLLVSSR